MTSLLYHPHWGEARARLTAWWEGGDIGRPALQILVERPQPVEEIPFMPEPAGWVTDYSTLSLPYRVFKAQWNTAHLQYFGEAVPNAAPGDLAPNTLALYLGCHGVEMPGTVWCEPCIAAPETARFDYDPHNFYWKFSLEAYRRAAEPGRGRFLLAFPDLIEGLDTLAALRGTDRLLFDLLERPEWVQTSLRQITDRYFRYYDVLYDLLRDEVGGSTYWVWAPGRITKLQCDFSAMISAEMFHEFMVPVLSEMCERVSYALYHWDGPGAICHHDALLGIPRLQLIQWQPGAGADPIWSPTWWPLYHKTLEAGKKLMLFIGGSTREEQLALKREFGEKLKNTLLIMAVGSQQEAEDTLKFFEM